MPLFSVNDDADPDHFNCADAALVNCPASFPLSYFDYTMNQYIVGEGGMRAMVQANGEPFHLVLQWIHWPNNSGYLDQSAAEVGEHMLAVFLHSRNKFGFVPDIVDMMVEPDNHGDASVRPRTRAQRRVGLREPGERGPGSKRAIECGGLLPADMVLFGNLDGARGGLV